MNPIDAHTPGSSTTGAMKFVPVAADNDGMKWIARVLALLGSALLAPSPLFFVGFFVRDFGVGLVSLALFLVVVAAAVPAALVVGLPGLIWFDRARPQGRLPRILLGAGIGLAAGAGSCWLWINQALPLDLAMTLGFLFGGIVMGLLGIPVYRFCLDVLELWVPAVQETGSIKLSREDRRELGSRLDRDRW